MPIRPLQQPSYISLTRCGNRKEPYRNFSKSMTFLACLIAFCLPSLVSAQTINIPTSWNDAQVQNAVANAGANSTIRFAAGTHTVRRLEVKSNNVTIEGSGNLATTIDGQYQGGEIILVSNQANVRIRNLNLKGAEKATYTGVVAGLNANGLIVEDCDIEVERTQGGVYLNGGGGQIIRNNKIYNPAPVNFEFAADLIYIQNTNSNGWLVDSNTLLSQGRPTKYANHSQTLGNAIHVDNIQTLNCQGGTVNANYIRIDIDIERHFHGVLIENGGGTYNITNNYMVNIFPGNAYEDEQLDFILGMYGSSSSKYLVYNNTIVGEGEQLLRYAQTNPNSEFRNNILYRRTRGRGPIAKIEGGSSNGKWSHNLFFNHGPANGTVVDSINGWRNVASFDSLTGGSGSLFGDPQFVLEGPELLSGSPALNAGTFLAAVPTDLDGNSRDASPTIGAVEVGGGTPAPESISVDGPPIVAPVGSEVFSIDYNTNATRDIILDIFDANWQWKGQRRIENVSGNNNWTGSLSYNSISTATGRVKVSLLPNGGTWQDALEVDYLDFDVSGSQPAPDFEFILWNGSPGPGVTTHATWGVSGMGPGRWLRLDNVDLTTGHNDFAIRYSSTQTGTIEIRLGSPTGQLLGSANFASSGGWGKGSAAWTGTALTPVTGVHDVYIVMQSGNLNCFTSWFKNQ